MVWYINPRPLEWYHNQSCQGLHKNKNKPAYVGWWVKDTGRNEGSKYNNSLNVLRFIVPGPQTMGYCPLKCAYVHSDHPRHPTFMQITPGTPPSLRSPHLHLDHHTFTWITTPSLRSPHLPHLHSDHPTFTQITTPTPPQFLTAFHSIISIESHVHTLYMYGLIAMLHMFKDFIHSSQVQGFLSQAQADFQKKWACNEQVSESPLLSFHNYCHTPHSYCHLSFIQALPSFSLTATPISLSTFPYPIITLYGLFAEHCTT